MKYGYNIPAVSTKVQEKVKVAIENMTGLMVSDVNIRFSFSSGSTSSNSKEFKKRLICPSHSSSE